jgi:hypothetical protein
MSKKRAVSSGFLKGFSDASTKNLESELKKKKDTRLKQVATLSEEVRLLVFRWTHCFKM